MEQFHNPQLLSLPRHLAAFGMGQLIGNADVLEALDDIAANLNNVASLQPANTPEGQIDLMTLAECIGPEKVIPMLFFMQRDHVRKFLPVVISSLLAIVLRLREWEEGPVVIETLQRITPSDKLTPSELRSLYSVTQYVCNLLVEQSYTHRGQPGGYPRSVFNSKQLLGVLRAAAAALQSTPQPERADEDEPRYLLAARSTLMTGKQLAEVLSRIPDPQGVFVVMTVSQGE